MGSVQAAKTIGRIQPDEVIAAATAIAPRSSSHVIQLSGASATISRILTTGKPGRLLRVIGSPDGSNDMDGNPDTVVEGQMDLGSGSVQLDSDAEFVDIQLTDDRTWKLVRNTEL